MLSRGYIKSHAKDGFIKRLMSNKRAEREADALADKYTIARATGKHVKEVSDFSKGFKKVAFGSMGSIGARGGMKSFSKPDRIDPVSSRDALGASTKMPFSNPVGKFGKRPRSALMSLSRVHK